MNVHKTETRFRRGSWLITALLVAVVAAHMTLVFFPGQKKIAHLRSEIESRRLYIENSGATSAKLAAAQHELLDVRSHVDAWQRAASMAHRLPLLYGNINELSKKAGTVTTKFEPQMLVEMSALRQIPIHLACVGTFAQIHELIRSLESMPETTCIDSLQVSKVGQSSENVLAEISIVVISDNPKISNYTDINK
jgi:Tfp pilus assembly protein PilO